MEVVVVVMLLVGTLVAVVVVVVAVVVVVVVAVVVVVVVAVVVVVVNKRGMPLVVIRLTAVTSSVIHGQIRIRWANFRAQRSGTSALVLSGLP